MPGALVFYKKRVMVATLPSLHFSLEEKNDGGHPALPSSLEEKSDGGHPALPSSLEEKTNGGHP